MLQTSTWACRSSSPSGSDRRYDIDDIDADIDPPFDSAHKLNSIVGTHQSLRQWRRKERRIEGRIETRRKERRCAALGLRGLSHSRQAKKKKKKKQEPDSGKRKKAKVNSSP